MYKRLRKTDAFSQIKNPSTPHHIFYLHWIKFNQGIAMDEPFGSCKNNFSDENVSEVDIPIWVFVQVPNLRCQNCNLS